MKKYLIKYIFPLLFILLSVSPMYIFREDSFLLVITVIVSSIVVYRGMRIDNILWLVLGYWIIINLFAFSAFGDSISSIAYTFIGSITRIILAYMLIKYVGYNIFDYSERIIFRLLIISLPIFFLTEFLPSIGKLLSVFDLGSVAKQARDGGWNILVFTYNPWTEFRFSGFAWEPGACALVIIFGFIISIIRDGLAFDKRKVFYIICLIFTFSTAGYLAFATIIMVYLYNSSKKNLLYVILFLIILIPIGQYAYKFDFISGKIELYLNNAQQRAEEGFEDDEYRSISRLDYVILGANLLQKWPLGYGVSEEGRPKSNRGQSLKGANSLVNVAVKWGVLGFLLLVYFYDKVFKYFSILKKNSSYRFLYLPLMVMYFSNPVDRYPIFMGFIFFLFLCKQEIIYKINLSQHKKRIHILDN